MNIAIFLVSIIGIIVICYTINNYSLIYTENSNNECVKIVLYKYNVDYVNRKELISKIMNGNYNKILDVVDKIQIN